MDVRAGVANPGLPGRVPRAARGRARRRRHVPEHAERRSHRFRDGQHRAAERRAAAHVRRRRDAVAELGRVRGEPSARCPTQCADGTTGGVFASTAPNVTLFDKDYSAPRALRVEPPVDRQHPRQPFLAVRRRDVLAESQPGEHVRPELQSGGTVRARGRRRTVRCYAHATSIVPTTGAIASGEARLRPAFTHVGELRSDMKSEAQQFTFRFARRRSAPTVTWSLSYVYARRARAQARGFTAPTAIPLDARGRRSGFDSRHQIQLSPDLQRVRLGAAVVERLVPVRHAVHAARQRRHQRRRLLERSRVHLRSRTDRGLRRSPRQCNRCSRPASRSARDCLKSQLGQLAARNSCQGPWTTTANLTFSFNPIKVRLPQRATLVPALESARRGRPDAARREPSARMGPDMPFPVEQLLFVRGFDPTTQRYSYDVNQRFGATARRNQAIRAPVTLDGDAALSTSAPTRERQDAHADARSRPHDSTARRLPEPMLKAFYGSIGIMNPMAADSSPGRHAGARRRPGGQHRGAQPAYTISLDSDLVARREVSRDAPERLRPGRGVRPVSRRLARRRSTR